MLGAQFPGARGSGTTSGTLEGQRNTNPCLFSRLPLSDLDFLGFISPSDGSGAKLSTPPQFHCPFPLEQEHGPRYPRQLRACRWHLTYHSGLVWYQFHRGETAGHRIEESNGIIRPLLLGAFWNIFQSLDILVAWLLLFPHPTPHPQKPSITSTLIPNSEISLALRPSPNHVDSWRAIKHWHSLRVQMSVPEESVCGVILCSYSDK